MSAISSYHFAMVGSDEAAPALDDRTWADLNMDDVFAVLDRTQSSIGQQALYRRLRAAPQAPHLDAFERVMDRVSTRPGRPRACPARSREAQRQSRLRPLAADAAEHPRDPELVRLLSDAALAMIAVVGGGDLLAAGAGHRRPPAWSSAS